MAEGREKQISNKFIATQQIRIYYGINTSLLALKKVTMFYIENQEIEQRSRHLKINRKKFFFERFDKVDRER